MPPLPSREALEAMKRVDLQRICKDYGVKANLKSEALIELLLDTQSGPPHVKARVQHVPPPSRPPPPPEPTPIVTRRSVSTRQSSGRAGPSRVSSMIVHDISEDEADQENERQTVEREPPPQPVEQPPPRTRKAKELQTRLGMGKPVIAGGNGARNITRSTSNSIGSKGRRTKSSRSMIPIEATIIEEEPEAPSPPKVSEIPEPSQPPSNLPSLPSGLLSDNFSMSHVQSLIEKAINPLHDQIRVLKSELNQMQTMKAELDTLRSQVTTISKSRKNSLASEADQISMASLKEEIQQIKDMISANESPPLPSTPKGRNTRLTEPPAGFDMPAGLSEIFPGITETVLGKRHRTATPTQIEPDFQEDLAKTPPPKSILGPAKKKPKLGGSKAGGSRQSSRQASESNRATPNDEMNAFTVFQGATEPEGFDDAPPTNRLPEFFQADSPLTSTLARPKPTRSSATAAENQPHSFGFGFLPVSSTPRDPMYMPSFPYPEAPQSPSPAGPSSRYSQPDDIFKEFVSPIKTTRHYGALTQDRGVNPAAITQQASSSSKPRETSVHMGPVPSSSAIVDPPSTKATMYGTELDGDTRFGDFGLDHMATGYWANKRY